MSVGIEKSCVCSRIVHESGTGPAEREIDGQVSRHYPLGTVTIESLLITRPLIFSGANVLEPAVL